MVRPNFMVGTLFIYCEVHITLLRPYLESQWPVAMGYFRSAMGHFGAWYPVICGLVQP